MRRWSLAIFALSACTSRSEPAALAIEEPPAPSASDPARVPVAAASELPAATQLPATAPIIAPAPIVAPAPPSALPDGPIAAFVIVTELQTIVAPIDAAIRPDRADGVWVLDDAVAPPVVRFDSGNVLPTCECARAAECEAAMIVDASVGPICECDPPLVDDDACFDEDALFPVALVGGVLYYRGDTHDGCEGFNIYDVQSIAQAMVGTPASFDRTRLHRAGCNVTHGGVATDLRWPLDDDCGEDRRPYHDCDRCDEIEADDEIYMLHAGKLWLVEDEVDPSGAGWRRWSTAALTPKSCPSAADPCGSPKRFHDLDEASDFWVANDGAHALRRDDQDLAIVDGEHTIARGAIEAETIIGVRYHADARALILAMRNRAPRTITVCAAKGGPGTQCVEHMRAQRWDEAKSACELGLATTTKKASRGALLYNLGRIARAQGDLPSARARFRESLEVRPGNKVVKRALAELGPE